GETLHPVQRAFVDAGAVQCGFCTPGLVVATYALLQRNPEPSDKEVREALSGNICRCTGYGKMLEAVERAAAAMYRRCAWPGRGRKSAEASASRSSAPS